MIVESPYKGFVIRNEAYGKMVLLDCVRRGESPYASHLILTQCLDDTNAAERMVGIQAGFVWRIVADFTAFYCDFGFSDGMTEAFKLCVEKKYPFEIRTLWTKLEHVQLPQLEPTDGKT